jgi:Flp pilus assembly secretin CpaC
MGRKIGSLLVAAWVACGTAAWAAEPGQQVGKQVEIEVVIADLAGKDKAGEPFAAEPAEKVLAMVRKLEEQGKLESCTRVRLTTLEGQIAMAQFGERRGVVSGRSRAAGRAGDFGGVPQQTSYSFENLGTLVSATARVADEGPILIELQIERSRLSADAPANEAARPDGDTPPPRTLTATTKSTVRIADGQAVILGGLVQSSPAKDSSTTLIVVTARVLPPDPVKGALKAVGR